MQTKSTKPPSPTNASDVGRVLSPLSTSGARDHVLVGVQFESAVASVFALGVVAHVRLLLLLIHVMFAFLVLVVGDEAVLADAAVLEHARHRAVDFCAGEESNLKILHVFVVK